LLYENNFPQRHYLKVTLRGKPVEGQAPTSNRQGIGSRLIAHVRGQPLDPLTCGRALGVLAGTLDSASTLAGAALLAGRTQPLVRELYPLNSYRSQMPNLVHFGLGDAEVVDRLVIRWPSGLEQELTDVPADQHIVVDEGNPKYERVIPGQTIQP